MRVLLPTIIGLATLFTATSPAFAQTPADRADARCIMMFSVAAQDPKNREAAKTGSFYFLGKLGARSMTGKLGPVMVAEAKTLTTPAQAQAELTRCGNELNARVPEMGAALGQLQQASKAAAASRPRPPAK